MRTLKRVGAMVLTAVMLFSFVGCKKKQKGHDGAKSVQELVTKVVGVINGDIKYSEIESWMDWYAFVAFRMMEDTDMKCDLATAKAVVEDLDKDLDYIKKNHKKFVKAFEDAKGEELSEKKLRSYAKNKEYLDTELKPGGDAVMEQFRKFAPYDDKIDETRLDLFEEYGVGEYSIHIDDEDYHALEIQFYIDSESGKYVCYGVNYVC